MHLDITTLRHHDVYMRTTLTLDDAIAEKLKQLAHRRQESFKETVNRILLRGLHAQELGEERKEPYRVMTFESSFRPGVDIARLNQLSDELETDNDIEKL